VYFIRAIKLGVSWAGYVGCVVDMRKVQKRVVGKIRKKRIHV